MFTSGLFLLGVIIDTIEIYKLNLPLLLILNETFKISFNFNIEHFFQNFIAFSKFFTRIFESLATSTA